MQKTEDAKILQEDRGELFGCLRRKCHNGGQYSGENLSYLLRLGACPSAGGARAPLSKVLSKPPSVISPWITLDSTHRGLSLIPLLEFIASLTVSMVQALVFAVTFKTLRFHAGLSSFTDGRSYGYMLLKEHRR